MLNGKLYSGVTKRVVDFAVAVPALAVAGPVIAGLAIGVRAQMGSPVFFRQERPGLHGKPFWILKFRTMTDARDENGVLLSDEARLTVLGRFMREHSLDELPQLFSVLKGDMSVVGPRPLLMQYLARYSPEQARRHNVKPGITGWAQVNGRNALSWNEKFALDAWYVDHVSLGLDLKILAMTALKVLRRDGVSAQGHATMPEFMGSSQKP